MRKLSPEVIQDPEQDESSSRGILKKIEENLGDWSPDDQKRRRALWQEIEKKQQSITGDQGGFNPEGCSSVLTEMRSNRDSIKKIADWLTLSAVGVEMANRLVKDPGMKLDSRYHPGFLEVQVRGGKIVRGEHTEKVLTPEELKQDRNLHLRNKVVGDVGGNAAIDFHVLSGLEERDVELLKSAVGAEQELSPQDPDYQAYFQNVSLRKGRIHSDEIAGQDSEWIKDSRHDGTVYGTNIPNYVVLVRQNRAEKADKLFSVTGYCVFPDRLKQAKEAIALKSELETEENQ
ncbi:MAG: hypothetical protein WC768_00680 [Patescibacteria group bacterium]|jgi:hypothetical protein